MPIKRHTVLIQCLVLRELLVKNIEAKIRIHQHKFIWVIVVTIPIPVQDVQELLVNLEEIYLCYWMLLVDHKNNKNGMDVSSIRMQTV